ncbi:fatty acid desaturase [uncultured Erythrobacter sp.]|uniref:fatty acid desaturase n=1 Tax=uncultured Erythrobacter sp. TaxID=263913 RepID=UPI0026122B07|nr:fatty acid desaturase [uncultured Erythrobacter sp.]
MNAHSVIVPDDLSQLSDAELKRLELKIARKHSGMFPWEAVVWAFGNMTVWLSLWPLVMFEILPLWIAFPIATVNMALVYLPTHEAQHDIIGRPGTKWRWLNELVGHGTSWMLIYPFQVLRITHLDHHRHTNDPERDVDITSKAAGPWSAIWRAIQERQPGAKRSQDYTASITRAGRPDLLLLTLGYMLGFIGILGTLAWNGYAMEALFLWWLPYHIAITYIVFFLSWAPHHPSNETSRYRNSRAWKSKVGNWGSMWMQFHIVHHLHPYIPLTRTPAAFWEMKPILEARECDLGEL